MENSLHTSTIINLLQQYKKQLFIFVLAATILGAVATLIVPKYYLSSTTVIPSNPKATDKNFLYGKQLMELNSAYGMEEDLDRLLTTLRISSNFSKLVDSFTLINHYNITAGAKAKAYAMQTLVKNSSITRTENGAIDIKIWDKNKEMAANIANALVAITNKKLNENNQQLNNNYLESLQMQMQEKTKQLDALAVSQKSNDIKEVEKKAILALIEQDATAIAQLKASTQSNVASIIVIEKAYESAIADKPKLSFWLALSFFSSLLFGIAVIVFLHFVKNK
jgi:capsular polysaccharide biosynthesis protein